MRFLLPWIRTAVSLPAGVVAIELSHMLGEALFPQLYASDLSNTADRVEFLVAIVLAGAAGSFTVGFIAQHRLWLHMLLFLIVMVVIDIKVVMDSFQAQPTWFNTTIFVSMPLQLWLGASLVKMTCPRAHAPTTSKSSGSA